MKQEDIADEETNRLSRNEEETEMRENPLFYKIFTKLQDQIGQN